MGFEDEYTAIFDDIEASIVSLKSIKQVIYKAAGRGVIQKFPCVFINPGRFKLDPADSMNIADVGNYLLDIQGEIIVIIREADSEEWFSEIMGPIGDIIDAVFADQTLGGTCLEAYPHEGGPGEITLNNKLYYGGSVGIRALKGYP